MVARGRQPNMIADFNQIAAHCRDIASDVCPITLLDSPRSILRAIFLAAYPTLVFAPQRLLFYHPLRGTVCSGRLLPKSEEYRRLEAEAIPVPRWYLLSRSHSPDVSALGRYVVTKPDYGGRGADVRIRRASRVRWKPPNTPVRFAARSGVCGELLILGKSVIRHTQACRFSKPNPRARKRGSSRGQCGKRQIQDATVALGHNRGGVIGREAASMCVTILVR